jgi:DNA-binding NtrC family response regulator
MENKDIGILIVDDEFSVRDSLSKWFQADGFRVDSAESAAAAMTKLSEQPWDVILLDIMMPGMDGIEFNKHIKAADKDIIVIIMTAYASVDTAVEALKDGAFDYVVKPIDPDDFSHIVMNAVEKRRLVQENSQLRQKIEDLTTPDEIVGQSPKLKRVMEMIAAVAITDAAVMIRGESGSGKELVARAIHSNSRRRYAPIISISCGAVTETQLETELFGHEKGSFAGTISQRKGKLERAHHGTLFFDEIGSISPKMQSDLLRVIETKQFTRVGSDKPIPVDFRVICATNKNLEKAIVNAEFREDLYFRLNVFSIDIPPLRDRQEDIPLLANYFLNIYANSMAKYVKGISEEAMKMLLHYEWPGNVRELRNVVERAAVLCTSEEISPNDISFPFAARMLEAGSQTLDNAEKQHIISILQRVNWNISQAAHLLDIDRTTLYNKIKKYQLGISN